MPVSMYQCVLIRFFVSVDFLSQLVRHVNIFCVSTTQCVQNTAQHVQYQQFLHNTKLACNCPGNKRVEGIPSLVVVRTQRKETQENTFSEQSTSESVMKRFAKEVKAVFFFFFYFLVRARHRFVLIVWRIVSGSYDLEKNIDKHIFVQQHKQV